MTSTKRSKRPRPRPAPTTPEAPPAVLTVDELAARWRVDRKTVYSEIAAGRIPVLRLGRQGPSRRALYRVSLSAVLSIEQGRVAPPQGERELPSR